MLWHPEDEGQISSFLRRLHALGPTFPVSRLGMLALETTCKDRWRQVLNEADRTIPCTHLLTVQQGVSEAQYREMAESRIKLVVPGPLKTTFPVSVRKEVQTSGEFTDEVRKLDRPSR